MFNKYFLIPLLICFSPLLWAQHIGLTPISTLSIQENDITLSNAFNGGTNAVQFFEIDLNLDAQEELVVYDRVSRKVSVYEFKKGEWHYTPKYDALFPFNIRFWLCIQDLDNDGKKDLILGEDDGIYFYKNNSTSSSFSFSNSPKIINTTTFSGALTPLLCSLLDTPTFYDIDNDGLLDFFTFIPSIGGTIEFHKNQGLDEEGIPHFKKITNNWGNFYETGDCSTYVFGDQEEPSNGKIQHLGSSLSIYDVNGNGLADVLIGEMNCPNLVAIPNKGTTEKPLFTESIIDFPSKNPINITMFPAAFFIDFNKNGKKEMLVSQSITTNEGDLNDLSESTWLYESKEDNNNIDWEYTNSKIFQSFDLGERTRPFAIDIDDDGSTDLIIGYRNRFEEGKMKSGGIALLKNIGNDTTPQFDVVDRNYLSLQDWGKIDINPFILDFDNDGKKDLVVSARTPSSNEAGVYVFSNYTNDLSNVTPIKVLEHRPEESVSIYDINKDGLADILVGTFSGEIKVYLQDTNQKFTQSSDTFFSEIDADLLRKYPHVFIDQFDNNNDEDLLIMDDSGYPRMWRDYTSTSDRVYQKEVVYSDLLEQFSNNSIGKKATPTKIGDYIILGSESGGLLATTIDTYEPPTSITPPKLSDNIKVYPNPSFGEVTIHNATPERLEYTIISLQNKVIKQGRLDANHQYKFSTSHWVKGIYIVQIKDTRKGIITKKLIIK